MSVLVYSIKDRQRFEDLGDGSSILKGPLHMSKVSRAGSVSEILPCHSCFCKKFDVFI